MTPPTEDLRGVGVHEAEAGGQEARAALHLALVTGRSVRGAADTGDSDTTHQLKGNLEISCQIDS